jgi:hypothetical protein
MIQSNPNVNNNIIQKLKHLKLTKNPEDKINLLYELAQNLFHSDIKQAKKYAIRALWLARQKNDAKKVANLC